jgi:pyruvate/2-oxoglutarate dehydrogenase complex dihydrolipoamide dehydrogenase (E3) component
VNLDVLVIGAGIAGKYAAKVAQKNNVSVGIAEKEKVGGDCIFHACIPTKALVHAARTYKKIKRANYFGLPVFKDKANYKFVKAFKDSLISDISKGLDDELVKEGITLFRGDATFISPNEVVVGNDVIKAKNIIIATGSIPSIPPIPGLGETGYMTNIEALELEKVPDRLAIIGGGAVGVEFAQIFSSFGAKVHIYEALDRILSAEDEEISTALVELFSHKGISVSTSVKIDEVRTTSNGKLIITKGLDGKNNLLEYDEILVATGRKPAIDSLNLPAAKVQFNRGVSVDNSLSTNVPHIWAAGDVTGLYYFTYIAWEQGEVAGHNATNITQKELNYDILPKVTFCDPEVASVGLTETQAHERGYKVKVGKFDYSNLSRIMVSGDTEGFIKIIADEDSGNILGGHILGLEASSLIHEVAVAMKRLTVKDVGDTFHAYPTISEGIRYACQSIS